MRRRNLGMTPTMVLQSLVNGHRYGFDVMDATGLPSGVVYPALGRLEKDGLVTSRWEDTETAHGDGRPPRRYYEVTDAGASALEAALLRLEAMRRLTAEGREQGP